MSSPYIQINLSEKDNILYISGNSPKTASPQPYYPTSGTPYRHPEENLRLAAPPNPPLDHRYKKPTSTIPSPPHNMSDENLKLIIVGVVHCKMTYQQVSRALGYRPNSLTPYYTRHDVKEAYEHLRRTRSYEMYRKWGSSWKTYPGRDRITQQKLDAHKELLEEGKKRAAFAESRARAGANEQAARREWLGKMHRHGQIGDEYDLKWDALAERRR